MYINKINSIQWCCSGTAIGDALEVVAKKQFNEQYGMRNIKYGISRVMIILSDGRKSVGQSVQKCLKYFNGKDVYRYAIGIGDDCSASELSAIAQENVHGVSGF